MDTLEIPPRHDGDVWPALTTAELPVERAWAWVRRPDCGAIVVFGGTVRDHAEGRPGVSRLEYEAYESQVVPRFVLIAEEAKKRHDGLGRIVIWHRTGPLDLEECSVIVAVSAPHRGDAFEAARFCIDTLKRTVPIWKRETWEGGEDWGLDAHDVAEIRQC